MANKPPVSMRRKVETFVEEMKEHMTGEEKGIGDRSFGIFMGATVHDALAGCLSRRLVKGTNKNTRDAMKNMFEGYAPLSTFSAQIDMGFAVGLYDKHVWHDLNEIRKIRNLFAHATSMPAKKSPEEAGLRVSFQTELIAKACWSMRSHGFEMGDRKKYGFKARDLYYSVC
jgi:hypothetical protein